MFTKIIAGTALIAVSAVSAQAIEVSINPNTQQSAANQLGQKLSNRQMAIQNLQAQIKSAPADQKAMLQNRLTALQNTTDQKFQNAILHAKGNFLQQLGQKLSNRQMAIQSLQAQIKSAPADQKAMLQNRLTALQNTTDQKFQDAILHAKGNFQQAPANAQQELKDRVKSEVNQKLDNSKVGQAYQKYQNAAQQVQQDKQEIQDLKSSAENTKNLLKGW